MLLGRVSESSGGGVVLGVPPVSSVPLTTCSFILSFNQSIHSLARFIVVLDGRKLTNLCCLLENYFNFGVYAFSNTFWFSLVSATAGKPAIGGPWTLIDLDGNLVTNEQFKGKWLLLYFGFARCPDICPSEMVKVGKVMDTLKEKHPDIHQKIVPVFVSVDPARDSLKALKEYGKDFHPSYVFLTGAPNQVQAMAKKYRVYVSKADEAPDGDYLVDHSIVIYFHDDTGDLADCFTQSMRPSDIVEKIIERVNFVPTY
jgi:protein SCO1